MGLDCCGLGLHDIPSLRQFLKLDDWVIGVGGCVIGGRSRVQPVDGMWFPVATELIAAKAVGVSATIGRFSPF